jgi:probable rRNA maturation factor
VDVELVKLVTERFLKYYKKNKFEVSIAFVSDKEIKKLNKIYRGINKPTDVLSFEGEGKFLGEIIISYSQIKKQAKEFGRTTKQELVFILVHGLLHLLGLDDETEKGRLGMIEEGEKFIRILNFK